MTTHAAPAGVPDGLTPDELERWCNELAAFLTSDAIPSPFRRWASAQADRIDAYLATAADFEPGDDPPVEEAEDEPSGARSGTGAAARRPTRRPSRRRTPRPGTFSAQGSKTLLGVAAGVVALLVIFGVRELTNNGGSAGDLPGSGPAAAAFDEARAGELAALLETDPNNKDALFELGEMNFQAGRYEDSISWFTRLVAIDPTNVHALTDIGTSHFNLGRPAEAKEAWLKALDVAPDDVQVHYNLGFLYANVEPRDLEAAIAEWEKVIQLDPTSRLAETARVHVEGLRSEVAPAPAEATPEASPPAATAP